ncbi:hypothetical protein PS6_002030 [Mucor atramentarius]
MKLSVLIAGLFSAIAVKATIYEINFASHSDAVACQTKDILYINKVSDYHKIVGRKLVLIDSDVCDPVILEQFDAVCPALCLIKYANH